MRTATLLAACGQSAGPPADLPAGSEVDCEVLYETLCDEHQHAVRAWSAEIKAARGTDHEALRNPGPAREFLPRFEDLAERGCARAKFDVLDLLAHIEPFQVDQVEGALDLLDDLVHDHADAWWIATLADNDVLRYFLWSPRRGEAIALYQDLIERTPDEEARRALLLELGRARIRDARATTTSRPR